MPENAGLLHRHHLLLRRLHSLTGILPIGVFLIFHLTTNSSVLWGVANGRAEGEGLARGVETFQHEVAWINNLPAIFLIELTLWLSIAFHAGLGLVYALSGKPNVRLYPYRDNWRYTLQRWTGYVGVVFIFYHVATLRWGWTILVPGGAEWSDHFAASTLADALRGSTSAITTAGLLVSILYFVGVTCLVFHFANGLWTAAITWGLTVSQGAQKRWGVVCAAIGAGLMLAGWSLSSASSSPTAMAAGGSRSASWIENVGEDRAREIILEHEPQREQTEQAMTQEP
ncbi:MAG: hypothetical protein R3B57_14525 [Phycisphaerales bacterium]